MYTQYGVKFKEIEFNDQIYCVPKYAETRPSAITILNKKYYEYDTHVMMKYILEETGQNALHAGAFFGDMIPNFSASCKGLLYCFEPVLENYIIAKQCIEKNNIQNVVMVNAALSDKAGTAKFRTISQQGFHMGGWSHYTEDPIGSNYSQIVTMLPIDDLNIDNPIVLHLDLEGHEEQALAGAKKTIEKYQPILLIEHGDCKSEVLKNYMKILETPLIDVFSTEKNLDLAYRAIGKIKS